MAKPIILQNIDTLNLQVTNNINSIKNGDFTKNFDTQYKAAAIVLWDGSSTLNSFKACIDKLVIDNCNTVQFCIAFKMLTTTSNDLTLDPRINQSTMISVFQYAKSKRLKNNAKMSCKWSGY